MKNFILLLTLSGILVFIDITDLTGQEQLLENLNVETYLLYDSLQWSKTENELWKLEEAYMLNYMEMNLDVLSTFWHEKFIGWPSWSDEPKTRREAISILQKSENSKTKSFKIRPQKIVLIDTLAVVHYLIDVEQENEENEKVKTSFRVIHTWLKQNGKWRILSGMSAD